MAPNLIRTFLLLALTGVLVGGCKPPKEDQGKIRVVATTTMLADLVSEIGGEHVETIGIMKPGGDPHLYQPVPSDSRNVARSQLVIMNGLELEGWVEELVRNAGGDDDRPVVEATAGIKALDDPLNPGNPDPHVWFSVPKWKKVTANVRDALIDVDPEHEDYYRERADNYLAELDALDEWVRDQVALIPEEKRHLVTSHDAFNYLGDTYGLEVMAVQGISTASEASAAELREVIDYVRDNDVPAIFVETSVRPALIEQVQRETGSEIGGTLYSDSLGALDGEAGTYIGMVESNITTLVTALSGQDVAELPK